MKFYPVFLNLRGRRAVVIGGGAVAEQKVLGLLGAGAHVTVVSPETTPRLEQLAATGGIDLRRRPYRSGDLAGAWLAIAGTDNRGANAAVWAEAEREGVLLNAVDDLDHCSFIAPAVHREGDVTVAVSTSGKSPALAARLRQRVARLVGPAEARLCDLLGELRPELAARIPDTRARTTLWYRIVDSDVIAFVRRGDIEGARGRIEELVTGEADCAETGVVYLVGAGPGDPGLITARGLELLQGADVVVYDRLVAPALVAEAPPGAERVFVGKSPHGGGAAAFCRGGLRRRSRVEATGSLLAPGPRGSSKFSPARTALFFNRTHHRKAGGQDWPLQVAAKNRRRRLWRRLHGRTGRAGAAPCGP